MVNFQKFFKQYLGQHTIYENSRITRLAISDKLVVGGKSSISQARVVSTILLSSHFSRFPTVERITKG